MWQDMTRFSKPDGDGMATELTKVTVIYFKTRQPRAHWHRWNLWAIDAGLQLDKLTLHMIQQR